MFELTATAHDDPPGGLHQDCAAGVMEMRWPAVNRESPEQKK
jgi:hypothetical protein